MDPEFSLLLYRDVLQPFCSPTFLKQHKLRSPEDLLSVPPLNIWRTVNERAGIRVQSIDGRFSTRRPDRITATLVGDRFHHRKVMACEQVGQAEALVMIRPGDSIAVLKARQAAGQLLHRRGGSVWCPPQNERVRHV